MSHTLPPCPFCADIPSFSDVEEKDDRRYVEMRLECCITMRATLGWPVFKSMTMPAIKTKLRAALTESWCTRAPVDDLQEDGSTEKKNPADAESAEGGAVLKSSVAPNFPALLPRDFARVDLTDYSKPVLYSNSTSGTPIPMPMQTTLITADELDALARFDECAQDGEGYDVPKEMMRRLAEIGLVRRTTGARYELTEFGVATLEGRTRNTPAPIDIDTPYFRQLLVDHRRAESLNEQHHRIAEIIEHVKTWGRSIVRVNAAGCGGPEIRRQDDWGVYLNDGKDTGWVQDIYGHVYFCSEDNARRLCINKNYTAHRVRMIAYDLGPGNSAIEAAKQEEAAQ